MSSPVAVIISDIHYSLQTLELADAALRMAVEKANNLSVPLIIAGDLHDTKANLRGECINAMIKTFLTSQVPLFVLIGNHDKINEKGNEHSLNFLSNYAQIVSRPYSPGALPEVYLIPYQASIIDFDYAADQIKPGQIIVAHQGIQGSDAGHYIQDPTALAQADVAGLRVISGHYHRRQDITLPNGGLWSYIGNPYTLNFGEADHPEKGFRILNDDGTLDFVPTNLRKHVVLEYNSADVDSGVYRDPPCLTEDLLWIKMTGQKDELHSLNKINLARYFNIDGMDFRLDLIPLDTKSKLNETRSLTQHELLDSIIDNTTNTSDEAKTRIKQLWRDLL